MIYLEVLYHGVTDRDSLLQKVIYPCLVEDKRMGCVKALGIFTPIDPADGAEDKSELSCTLVFKDLAQVEEWTRQGKDSAVYREIGKDEFKDGKPVFYTKQEGKWFTSTEYEAIDWES